MCGTTVTLNWELIKIDPSFQSAGHTWTLRVGNVTTHAGAPNSAHWNEFVFHSRLVISDKCVFQSTRNASITKGGEPDGLPRRRWGTRHVLGKTGAWLSRGPVRQAMRSMYCIPVCSLMYTYVYVDMYHYKLMSYIYIYTHHITWHIYIYTYYDPCCILLFQVGIANNSAPWFTLCSTFILLSFFRMFIRIGWREKNRKDDWFPMNVTRRHPESPNITFRFPRFRWRLKPSHRWNYPHLG